MKNITSKFVTIFILIVLSIGIISNYIQAEGAEKLSKIVESEEITIEEISEKLIRFHVIANSDEEEDQELKLKVRDEILEYVQPLLKESKSIEESRHILNENNKKIIEIAEEVIKNRGYDYSVESTLSREYFPVKKYGNITLPQGEYEAYRIIIGNGQGQNWWCVMFPPICFVDITKGEVAYEETEKEMKSVLSNEEFNVVNNKREEKSITREEKLIDNTEDNNVVVKFKIIDLFKGLFQ